MTQETNFPNRSKIMYFKLCDFYTNTIKHLCQHEIIRINRDLKRKIQGNAEKNTR